MKHKQHGFSLIEILVTIIIVAILIALLTPAYRSYILKSNRSDAIRSLQNAQMLQEKYRVTNTSYGTLAQIGFNTAATNNSIGGLYTITASSSTSPATSYTMVAAGASSTQSADTNCTNFTITYANGTTTLSSTPNSDCWSQ